MKSRPTVRAVPGPLFLSPEGRQNQIFLGKEDAVRVALDLQRETGKPFAVVSHDYMTSSGYRTYTVERA